MHAQVTQKHVAGALLSLCQLHRRGTVNLGPFRLIRAHRRDVGRLALVVRRAALRGTLHLPSSVVVDGARHVMMVGVDELLRRDV